MIPNIAWLKSVEQFDDEAIASLAVRLAPVGKIDIDTLLRLHLDMFNMSAPTIASRPGAIAELAALGSFNLEKLSAGAWKIFKDRIEFLGCELPAGWFDPERRRVAPGILAADGANARVRNLWLLSAMPCDIITGEAILDRCPACLNLLGWTKLQHVWSCQICGFDLRSERPRYSPPETVAAANELARYVIDGRAGLPPPLNGLPCLDILKLASWMAYFRGIPEHLFLNVTAKGAAEGFAQLKRWPSSFDAIVVKLLGDLAGGDMITRSAAAGGLLASIERLSSASAREVVKARVAEVLGLGKESIEAFHEVMEPVLAFDEPKHRYFSPRMPAMASTRSSHERARSRPA
jgi:hypothetical protein